MRIPSPGTPARFRAPSLLRASPGSSRGAGLRGGGAGGPGARSRTDRQARTPAREWPEASHRYPAQADLQLQEVGALRRRLLPRVPRAATARLPGPGLALAAVAAPGVRLYRAWSGVPASRCRRLRGARGWGPSRAPGCGAAGRRRARAPCSPLPQESGGFRGPSSRPSGRPLIERVLRGKGPGDCPTVREALFGLPGFKSPFLGWLVSRLPGRETQGSRRDCIIEKPVKE